MGILSQIHFPRYYTFLVRPIGEFSPATWQETPEDFRIIRQVATCRRGQVLRFTENQKAIANGTAGERWVIQLPLQKIKFGQA